MTYEAKTGLGVNNNYGQRKSGGTIGEIESDGLTQRQFVMNLDKPGLPVQFPLTAKCFVTGIDTTFVTGTVTSVTIGGVECIDADPPVEITEYILGVENTLLVKQVGGTAGLLIIYFAEAAMA